MAELKEKFNIFKILEKDDKELIHSSFLKFLMTEDFIFARQLVEYAINESFEINIEKAYTYKRPNRIKSKRCRFDIELRNDNTIIVIENKFKSFPLIAQLLEYDEALSILYPKLNHVKILLCFERKLVKRISNWKIIDYSELLPLIDEALNRFSVGDKKTFVSHYFDFLKEYYTKYNQLDKSAVKYFLNQNDKESKFWIKLIYSSLALRFENYFNESSINVEIVANPGNTNIPLLNIIPKHWEIEKKSLLIQVQDGLFKFYAHTGDKEFLLKIREFAKGKINNDVVKFKKETNRNSKSECVFSININEKLSENTILNEQNLFDFILKFYEIIDERIIQNYR